MKDDLIAAIEAADETFGDDDQGNAEATGGEGDVPLPVQSSVLWRHSLRGAVVKNGVQLIEAERIRQITEEGYTMEHDDEHDSGELAMAAALYATPVLLFEKTEFSRGLIQDPWRNWLPRWDDARPQAQGAVCDNTSCTNSERIRQLVKAGALIAAEIDRLQRLEE